MKTKVLVISGSTASGKSDLAVELAQQFNGEIISCDSVQVYRELSIASAKITSNEMKGIPHHLIDICHLDEAMDVSLFQTLARQKISEITNRNNLPICAGGTGLYLKSILYDYQFHQEEPIEQSFDHFSNEELYHMLQKKDPAQAEKIHVNNRQRLLRVHQLMAATQSTRSEIIQQQSHSPLYDIKVYYLMTKRDVLVDRINRRVDAMFEKGLLEEVLKVTDGGKNWEAQGLSAIGYKEFKPYFNSKQTLEEVKDQIKIHTRQFSKRQMTWFKHQMEGKCVDILDLSSLQQMKEEISRWINSQE